MLHDCIFKQCSAAAGGRWGAAPDPAGEDDPPWGPAGCGRCKTYFSSNLPQRQRERWGAAPDPAGEDNPPRTPPVADGIRLISQAVCRSCGGNENLPLPGRPAKPARLCASAQGKGWRFPEKQASLFSRKSPAFSVARELSCCPKTSRRALFVISSLQYRQGGSRDEPQATACGGCFACGEINRNKQSPLWRVAPIEVADQCPWFGGSGAEDASAYPILTR